MSYIEAGSTGEADDAQSFRALSLLPTTHVDSLSSKYPGWLQARLEWRSGWLDSRLRKRYGAPFVAPYPPTIVGWLVDIVQYEAMLKRGIDPQDEQVAEIKELYNTALAQVKEAADSVDGLFDLPLAAPAGGALTNTGITRGTPLSYSEQSPYVGVRDVQSCAGAIEDAQRGGTGG